MKAVIALDRDSTFSATTSVAYYLLDTYVKDGQSYPDTNNLNWAVLGAFSACDTAWSVLQPVISEGVTHTSATYRLGAILSLERFASKEESAAVSMLSDLAQTSLYRDTREYAAYFYNFHSETPDSRYRTRP
jgi:hypothetical protein